MVITERLLQYIWQFQYFNRQELTTVQGESLQIIQQGKYNSNQGPDFLESKLIVGGITWAGNVELHIKTSDWDKHAHNDDENYRNIILHVVWEHDINDYTFLPLIALKDRVSKMLLEQYESWMQQQRFIPCENQLTNVHPLIWTGWKERLVVERLERKSEYILQLLEQSKQHWEEVSWWMIARNFGIKVNADSFENIARSLPVLILSKHKNQVLQLEALLFGQAGLLNGRFKESYPIMLQREFKFLKRKYSLPSIQPPLHFLRMRPSNFPTIRLAQLAKLVHSSNHLFSAIKEKETLDEIKQLFNVVANDYWHYHYRFDEATEFLPKQLGDMMLNNIVINSVVPLLFSYGHFHHDAVIKARASDWLEKTVAESNSIVSRWKATGIKIINAHDTQALIELRSQYCEHKRCLDCAIGCSILKNR